jgi:hypothetical protein
MEGGGGRVGGEERLLRFDGCSKAKRYLQCLKMHARLFLSLSLSLSFCFVIKLSPTLSDPGKGNPES